MSGTSEPPAGEPGTGPGRGAAGGLRARGWAADPQLLDEFLAEPNLCRVATVDADGEPHVVPAWFWWDGDAFHVGAQDGDRKVANVRRSGRAAIEVDGDIRRKRGILARGRALVVDGEDGWREYVRITTEQVRRYQPDRPPRETAERYGRSGRPVVIVVTPERIISWGR
jgi:PPOX class probable F420-dependent enzyme